MHDNQDWEIRDLAGKVLDEGQAYLDMDESLSPFDLANDYYTDHPNYAADVIVIIDDGEIQCSKR